MAPIPGKSAVGVEIPNHNPSTVPFAERFEFNKIPRGKSEPADRVRQNNFR